MATTEGGADATRAAGDGELRDAAAEPSVLSSNVVFDGAVWDIRRETFEYNGEQLTREFMDHTGAVAVLALDADERVLLIRQYRHPVRKRDWEVPAGLLDIQGEAPLLAAQRELAEEADLVAAEWFPLAKIATSPGGSNEYVQIYLARDLRSTDEAFARDAEEADIELRWAELAEAQAAVLAGGLCNAILQVAILTASAHQAAGWTGLERA